MSRQGKGLKNRIAVCAVLLCIASGSENIVVSAAPGYDQAASDSDMAAAESIGSYGMTPIYAIDLLDGTYTIDVDSSSSFFRVQEAELLVKDGEMQAVLRMYSDSYSYVFLGTAKEAAAASMEEYIPLEEQENDSTFTISVTALNQPIECAAFSKKKAMWYGRQILLDASTLPTEAVRFAVPDYSKIEKALKWYDKTKETDRTEAETQATEIETEAVLAAAMDKADGTYSIEVTMTGGSGRASVSSPTWLYVQDGKAYAKLLWSSSYYDYMIVGGQTYKNETTDGSNSTFTIPITLLDEPMKVIADTTAMGDPLEIEYALTFYGDRVGGTGNIPQEAAKRVLVLAVIIIVVGGILNYFVKKKRNH